MTGGSLVSKNGDMFYVTNTSSIVSLSGVDLTLADGAYLLRVSGNEKFKRVGPQWVQTVGIPLSIFPRQTISGDIYVDLISTLEMNISDSSSFTGSINSDGSQASALTVTIDSTSTWTLTADSYVTSFNGSLDNVVANGYTLYVNGSAVN